MIQRRGLQVAIVEQLDGFRKLLLLDAQEGSACACCVVRGGHVARAEALGERAVYVVLGHGNESGCHDHATRIWKLSQQLVDDLARSVEAIDILEREGCNVAEFLHVLIEFLIKKLDGLLVARVLLEVLGEQGSHGGARGADRAELRAGGLARGLDRGPLVDECESGFHKSCLIIRVRHRGEGLETRVKRCLAGGGECACDARDVGLLPQRRGHFLLVAGGGDGVDGHAAGQLCGCDDVELGEGVVGADRDGREVPGSGH
mmetsp:Transcript_5788/g.14069  ORF Transcript_5788/g.14069 Transcript_5788/m.14069 type:complete len:260 (+) Transcript_5788:1363-2142(+)